VLAGPALAQTPFADREPGLWELKLVEGSQLANVARGVQGLLNSLPEGQRKQVENLMSGAGVNLNIPTVSRQCLTPEIAQTDIKTYLARQGIDCSELEWQDSGDKARFSFVCKNPQGDWTGQGRIWDATARQFKSEATVQGKYQGQRVAVDMQHEARWLGPDCQDVKPLD